ncbi:MAG: right-handed parallel beta-helix repeat-containing protein [Planctomycetota bacterium]|nr:right-handed parallel beta-helix repeat-containing protein [Planctomycetota bacterium]
MRPLSALLLVALLAVSAHAAPREIRVKDRAGLVRALDRAKAGTTILLAPGVYAGGLYAAKLRGEPKRSIVIAAAEPKKPPVFRGGTSGIQLSQCVSVELRDLVFEGATGNGLNIDDGGAKGEGARDLRLTRITVRNVGPGGNRDGIKLSGIDGATIRECRIERWGSGGSAIDMVGCHDVEVSRCRIGPARGDFASGIQAKGGSHWIRILQCTFTDAGGRGVNAGGSTGLAYFRPADANYEASRIVVENCIFSGGLTPIAFVGCDGATFRNNLVYRPRRWALRILQESRDKRFVRCRNGVIESNLVVFRSDELRSAVNIGPGTLAHTFRFAGNGWFCEDAPATTKARIKLPTREKDGVYGVDPKLKDPSNGDFTFARKGQLKGVGPRQRDR